jgi:ankyrin repeat protein
MQARKNSNRTLIWTQPHTIPLPPSKVGDQRQQKSQQQKPEQQKQQQQKSQQQGQNQLQQQQQQRQQQQQLQLELQLPQVHQNQISQAKSVSCPSLGTNSTPRTSPRPQAELAQQQTRLTYETEARTPSSERDNNNNNKQKQSQEESMQWINGLPVDDLTFDLLSDDAYLKPVQLLGDVSSKDLSDYLNNNKGLSTMVCGMDGMTEGPAWEENYVPVVDADGAGGREVGDGEDDDSEDLEEDCGSGDIEEDYSGFNALHLAASIGQVSTVRLLLQARPVDVDRAAEGGHRHAPLHIASAHHHLDVVRVLLDHGAAVRLQDGVGCTPLHVAVRAGAHAITRLLVCWCIELLHVRNAAGRTPLHDAIIKGDEEMVRLLLECGADPAAVVAQDSAPGYSTANRS